MMDQEADVANFAQYNYTTDGRMLLKTHPPTVATPGNYWYANISRFCFDATQYTHFTFDLVAPANSSFYVEMWTMDSSCTTKQSGGLRLNISNCKFLRL